MGQIGKKSMMDDVCFFILVLIFFVNHYRRYIPDHI